MLNLLFYLLLQLGLLGGPSDKQQNGPANPPTSQADAVLKVDTPVTDVDTDVNIGGSGWDDKN
jgi:hypothetical protein